MLIEGGEVMREIEREGKKRVEKEMREGSGKVGL